MRRAPSLIDLFAGRVTAVDFARDLVTSIKIAEAEHAAARLDGFDVVAGLVVPTTDAELYEELRVDLERIGFELVDFRQHEKSKRGARKGSRRWDQIVGTCGHQTAALIDDVERCTRIPAGALVTLTAVGLAHPPTAYLYAQHAGNRKFNSLEIACRAAGIEGDPRTFWRSRKNKAAGRTHAQLVREATEGQLLAAFLVWRYWHRLNALHGAPHSLYLWHRNAHRSRVSDPGSRIAGRLSQRLEHELELRPAGVLGSGHPTPARWRGAAGVPYSSRVD